MVNLLPRNDNQVWCWFCQKHFLESEVDRVGAEFTWEFDAYFHLECLRNALRDHPDNREAQIIADETDWTLEELELLMEETADVR